MFLQPFGRPWVKGNRSRDPYQERRISISVGVMGNHEVSLARQKSSQIFSNSRRFSGEDGSDECIALLFFTEETLYGLL